MHFGIKYNKWLHSKSQPFIEQNMFQILETDEIQLIGKQRPPNFTLLLFLFTSSAFYLRKGWRRVTPLQRLHYSWNKSSNNQDQPISVCSDIYVQVILRLFRLQVQFWRTPDHVGLIFFSLQSKLTNLYSLEIVFLQCTTNP